MISSYSSAILKVSLGNFCLLIVVFRLGTFNVIIYMTGLKSIILLAVFYSFLQLFVYSSLFNAFSLVN